MIIGISGRIGSGKDTVGKIIQHLTSEWADEEFRDVDMLDVRSDWQIKKFADKLKDIVCLLIGCSREELEDAEFKNKKLGEEWMNIFYNAPSDVGRVLVPDSHLNISQGDKLYQKEYLTPRLLLQRLGTDCGRDIIHPNIWVNALFADYPNKDTYVLDNPDLALFGSKVKFVELEIKKPNWIITDVRFPNEAQAIKDRGGVTIRVNRPRYTYESDLPEKSSPLQHAERGKELYNHPSEIALDNAEFDYTIDNNGTIEELIEKVRDILVKEDIVKLNGINLMNHEQSR